MTERAAIDVATMLAWILLSIMVLAVLSILYEIASKLGARPSAGSPTGSIDPTAGSDGSASDPGSRSVELIREANGCLDAKEFAKVVRLSFDVVGDVFAQLSSSLSIDAHGFNLVDLARLLEDKGVSTRITDRASALNALRVRVEAGGNVSEMDARWALESAVQAFLTSSDALPERSPSVR